jgi:hypothetical protein
MKEITVLDRILLLGTGLLAAYQIAIGIEGLTAFVITSYMVAFGVLLVAGLLLIILGFDVLNSPTVVVISTLIPLSLSLGLVSQYRPTIKIPYLIFAILGLLAITLTRSRKPSSLSTAILASIHGIAGIVITFLPLLLVLREEVPVRFIFVGIGGGLIGIGGLLLSFLRIGKPIIEARKVYSILPILLLIMTTSFVVGMASG